VRPNLLCFFLPSFPLNFSPFFFKNPILLSQKGIPSHGNRFFDRGNCDFIRGHLNLTRGYLFFRRGETNLIRGIEYFNSGHNLFIRGNPIF